MANNGIYRLFNICIDIKKCIQAFKQLVCLSERRLTCLYYLIQLIQPLIHHFSYPHIIPNYNKRDLRKYFFKKISSCAGTVVIGNNVRKRVSWFGGWKEMAVLTREISQHAEVNKQWMKPTHTLVGQQTKNSPPTVPWKHHRLEPYPGYLLHIISYSIFSVREAEELLRKCLTLFPCWGKRGIVAVLDELLAEPANDGFFPFCKICLLSKGQQSLWTKPRLFTQ